MKQSCSFTSLCSPSTGQLFLSLNVGDRPRIHPLAPPNHTWDETSPVSLFHAPVFPAKCFQSPRGRQFFLSLQAVLGRVCSAKAALMAVLRRHPLPTPSRSGKTKTQNQAIDTRVRQLLHIIDPSNAAKERNGLSQAVIITSSQYCRDRAGQETPRVAAASVATNCIARLFRRAAQVSLKSRKTN